jgi:hypothetical protein
VNDDIERIMEETPEGDNHGIVVDYFMDDGTTQVTRRDLAGRLAKVDQKGLLTGESRFGIVVGKDEGGLVAHRGVLQDDEYVDFFLLREQVEAEFGMTYGEITTVYQNGRPNAAVLQNRAKVDARLLELSRAGGNMAQLAKALGLSEKTIDRAIARAREIDVQPMVPTGVVKTTRVCFKTGEPGATLRKRRFSESPAQWVGAVALCDDEYAKGFDRKPGNPAYWDFRDARTPLRGGPDRPAKRAQRFPADYPSDQAYADFLGR